MRRRRRATPPSPTSSAPGPGQRPGASPSDPMATASTAISRCRFSRARAAPYGWQLRVGATDQVPDAQAAWFYARTKTLRVDADGQDYVILDATGTGHVVGVVLTAGCAEEGHCQLAQLPGLDGAHLE